MTHSFKKNTFPLEKAKGGLHFVLACKTMIMNRKQNIMIALSLPRLPLHRSSPLCCITMLRQIRRRLFISLVWRRRM